MFRGPEQKMTTNRCLKAAVRAHQHATGVPYSVARREMPTLAAVMHDHPTLNAFGFGVFNDGRKPPAEREQELHERRDRLRRAAPGIDEVRDWLMANLAPIKTPTQSSYGLKHIVERAIGRYVTNGELIAAAVVGGYPISRPHGPNVLVAVCKRDITRVTTRRR